MGKINSKYLLLLLLLAVSCGGPDALVINHVNGDGSVDRRIILTWDKFDFDLDNCQVPIDSTWNLENSIEISEKGDTTWVLTADKHFESVDAINKDYLLYEGSNPKMEREASFRKSFRWFNTVYYFSEMVEGVLEGYSPSEYFTPEELNLFYMPEGLIKELRSGPDSLAIMNLEDTLEVRSEIWMGLCLIRGAFNEVERFAAEGIGENIDVDNLWSRENDIAEAIRLIDGNEIDLIDSILGKGFYKKHQIILDTAIAVMEEKFKVVMDADEYLLQASMPGELISTNGYIDVDSNILWKVDGDCILSDDYIMWAESKELNEWAWIITLLFLIFVISGVARRLIRNRK